MSAEMLLQLAQHAALSDAGYQVYRIRKIKPRTIAADVPMRAIPLCDLPRDILDRMRTNLGLVLRMFNSLLRQVACIQSSGAPDVQPCPSRIVWLESEPFAMLRHPFVTSPAGIAQVMSWLLARIFLGREVADSSRSLPRLAAEALSTRHLVTSTHARILELLEELHQQGQGRNSTSSHAQISDPCTNQESPHASSAAIARLVVMILRRIRGEIPMLTDLSVVFSDSPRSSRVAFITTAVRILSQAACIHTEEPTVDDEELVNLLLTLNKPELESLNLEGFLPKVSCVNLNGMGRGLLEAVRKQAEFEARAGADPVDYFRKCFIASGGRCE